MQIIHWSISVFKAYIFGLPFPKTTLLYNCIITFIQYIWKLCLDICDKRDIINRFWIFGLSWMLASCHALALFSISENQEETFGLAEIDT